MLTLIESRLQILNPNSHLKYHNNINYLQYHRLLRVIECCKNCIVLINSYYFIHNNHQNTLWNTQSNYLSVNRSLSVLFIMQHRVRTAHCAGLAGVPGDIADTGPSISWYLFKCVRVLSWLNGRVPAPLPHCWPAPLHLPHSPCSCVRVLPGITRITARQRRIKVNASDFPTVVAVLVVAVVALAVVVAAPFN